MKLKNKKGPDPRIKTLDDAEEAMLKLYQERLDLQDGQSVLDLGCGWGSFTLWAAPLYPNSHFLAVSNSRTQKEFIMNKCKELNYDNVEVLTKDVNDLELEENQFDRIISIEMLEHVKNYKVIFQKISHWMKPDGLFFAHVFAHRYGPYHFKVNDDSDWMAKYFFTNGTMPSSDLFLYFQEHLTVIKHWNINGRNYKKTSDDWLALMDANITEITNIFRETYGEEYRRWLVYWRVFYLAVSEFFGLNKGDEFIVTHYLFKNNK